MTDIRSVPPFEKGARSIRAAHLNAIREAALNAVQTVVSGPFRIESMFLGILDDGEETPYTDERYWVRRATSSNTEGDETVALEVAALDVVPFDEWFTATNLAEIVGGTHALAQGTPVVVLAAADEQSPPVRRYYFSTGGTGTTYATFAVKVWRDGGTTDGDADTQCDRTYKVRTLPATDPDTGGVLLGTGLTPKERRPAQGKLDTPSTTGAGVIGEAYYDDTSAFCLADANETFKTITSA